MNNTKISFIGCGNMGRSLIGGLIKNGHNPQSIRGGEPDKIKADLIESKYKINVYRENKTAIINADVIILAVKPQNILKILSKLSNQIQKDKALIISIAAGVHIRSLENILGNRHPIIRTMPNTPALVGAGASSLFANESVSETQKKLAEEIIGSVGLALWLDNEDLMDIVTALSGSGPAYFFLIMEVMEKAAVKLGLPPNQARLLTSETAFGAAKMVLENNYEPAALRREVTSPGGTTEQALKVLIEQGHIEQLFMEALSAAKQRSQELAENIEKEV